MTRPTREEERSTLLGSVGLNSLGDLYSVFPPKAREFSEGLFGRLKDILQKSPHTTFLRELLAEEEPLPLAPVLWNNPFGHYLAKELDRLQYEFSDELLESRSLLSLAFELQTFLTQELHAEVAGFSFSSGFSALMEAVRLSVAGAKGLPHVVLPETLPVTWRRALQQNFPGLKFVTVPLNATGSLAWEEVSSVRDETVLVVSVLDSARVKGETVRSLFPAALWTEVVLDPLTLYAEELTLDPSADFRVLELEEILSSQRQVTGLSAGVLAGKRSHFEKAEVWLVGLSRITHGKSWFQPSTGSTMPLPRFLPLESLKAILLWRVHEKTSLARAWRRSRDQFTLLKDELAKMGVPSVVAFPEGRQGIFRVPKVQVRLTRAQALGWNDVGFAEQTWGTGQEAALVSGLWLRVGAETPDAHIKQLIEALTHDG